MKPVAFVCAWCERVRTSAGDWREAQSGELRQAAATHGICPSCLDRETREAMEPGALFNLRASES